MTMTLRTPTKTDTIETQTLVNLSDLNFAETLHKAAVKLLTKRNVIQGVIESKGTTMAEAQQQPQQSEISSMDRHLADSIATIRKNVSRVLQMYFRTQNTTSSMGVPPTKELDIGTMTTSKPSQLIAQVAATMTSEIFQNSTYYNSSSSANTTSQLSNNGSIFDVISTSTMTHLTDIPNATLATTARPSLGDTALTAVRNITYPSYGIPISSAENCSTLFTNYTPAHTGKI